jgi:hypothetical protein
VKGSHVRSRKAQNVELCGSIALFRTHGQVKLFGTAQELLAKMINGFLTVIIGIIVVIIIAASLVGYWRMKKLFRSPRSNTGRDRAVANTGTHDCGGRNGRYVEKSMDDGMDTAAEDYIQVFQKLRKQFQIIMNLTLFSLRSLAVEVDDVTPQANRMSHRE